MESANFWTKKKGQELFEQALQFDAEGKVAEAVEAYQKSLEECPRNAQAHYNLGVALATDGKISQALRSWQRALWLEPAFRLELIKAFDIADELAEEVIGGHEEFAARLAKAA
ncbi:MAG TPA: tetratricopeptide repeat protein [Candidatus Rifleibacterium sp.]|nr:tetratricopeptide repeat protein [Candidatus Rifleibacterium sp.]